MKAGKSLARQFYQKLKKSSGVNLAALSVAAAALFAPIQSMAQIPIDVLAPRPTPTFLPNKSDYLPILPALDKRLSEAPQKQFVFFGDTDHREREISGFLSRPDAIATLASHGFKKIVFECPIGMQPLVDHLQMGLIDRETFISAMAEQMVLSFEKSPEAIRQAHGQTADMILNANKQGLSVEPVDLDLSFSGDDSASPLARYHDEQLFALKEKNPEVPFKEIKEQYFKKLPKKDVADWAIELLNLRLANDKKIAEYIKKRAGNDRTAIIYGVAHKGIIAELGAGNVLEIPLISKKSDAPTRRQDNSLSVDGNNAPISRRAYTKANPSL